MAEIPFEIFALALEAAHGTPIALPTHYINALGTLAPKGEKYKPEEASGTLAKTTRSKTVRRWGEWEAEGALDVYTLPLLLNMLLNGGVPSPTTPTGTADARLWEFVRRMRAPNNLRSATIFWGEPATQVWQGAYAMIDELSIEADGTGTDGTTMSASGMSHFPAKMASPTLPTQLLGPLISPLNMQLWLDVTGDYGTTEIHGTLLSAKHTISSGTTYKYLPQGPGAPLTYLRTGREKISPETTIQLELLDTSQYDLFEDGVEVRVRVRHNGPEIEPGFYHYVDVDIFGPLENPDWGDFEGSNRTIEFTIVGHLDPTLDSDLRVRVQNDRDIL